jgi:hypothetical protein
MCLLENFWRGIIARSPTILSDALEWIEFDFAIFQRRLEHAQHRVQPLSSAACHWLSSLALRIVDNMARRDVFFPTMHC